MLKIAGICLVLVGGVGTGWYAAYMARLRIALLQEFRHGLGLLYGEIEYAASDMAEAMEHVSRQGIYWKKFWSEVAAKLQQRDGQSLWNIWKGALHTMEKRRFFTKEDNSLFEQIGENLGNVDRQTQLHTLELFGQRLDYSIQDAQAKYAGQARLCKVLGITGAAFTIVLFL